MQMVTESSTEYTLESAELVQAAAANLYLALADHTGTLSLNFIPMFMFHVHSNAI